MNVKDLKLCKFCKKKKTANDMCSICIAREERKSPYRQAGMVAQDLI